MPSFSQLGLRSITVAAAEAFVDFFVVVELMVQLLSCLTIMATVVYSFERQ